MFEETTLDLTTPEKDIPFKVKANKIRQYSEDQIEQADKLYTELRESGHIDPSKSTWMSLLVIVPKPDGSYRAAVDYSNLNKYLKDDPYEIPNINVLLQKLASHKIFSTCDFKSAFYQFPLRKQDKHLTAVFFPGKGKYEFNKCPMGIKTAPAYMMRYMYELFRDYPFVFVYMDDLNHCIKLCERPHQTYSNGIRTHKKGG